MVLLAEPSCCVAVRNASAPPHTALRGQLLPVVSRRWLASAVQRVALETRVLAPSMRLLLVHVDAAVRSMNWRLSLEQILLKSYV